MRSKTTEQFVLDSRRVHGDRYDYCGSVYVSAREKVKIMCREHGYFEIAAIEHTSLARGCPVCSARDKLRKITLSQDAFIQRVIDLHGDKYGLDKAVYAGNHTPVILRCSVHGYFTVIPANMFFRGDGCKKCAVDSKKPLRKVKSRADQLLYRMWWGMIIRCRYASNNRFRNYGGRGIKVCAEWEEFTVFKKWAIAHGYKRGHECQLDRIDNDGNYCPENCRFVTILQNAQNRRGTIKIAYQGVRYSLSEFAGLHGLKVHTLKRRWYKLGKPLDLTDELVNTLSREVL